jgi:bacteriocin biosynthesis cyclodehydratase domain-containing protein
MCMGTGADFEITEATAAERTVIERLSQGWWAEDQLREAVRQRGGPQSEVAPCLAALEEHDLLERLRDEGLLSVSEAERFDRQLIYWADLAEAGDSAPRIQRRVGDSTVVVLGCGGLGSWAAAALVCAGVGSMTLIDDDRVERSNLNRQLLFGECDVGRPKVECAAHSLRRHRVDVNVEAIADRVDGPEDLRDVLNGADVLIQTADWPPFLLPRWVNRACIDANVPYITAAQFLPRVRIGPTVVPGQSACWECLERQTRTEHPRYAEMAEGPPRPSTSATLGPASGLVGSLVAMEVLHLLTGSVRPATVDAALVVDLRSLGATWERVVRDPRCPECAQVPSVGGARPAGAG